MKRFFNEYLSFSRKDRIGVISLLFIITGMYCLPFFFRKKPPLLIKNTHSLLKSIDSLDIESDSILKKIAVTKQADHLNGELFTFDPNTLDITGWSRLGLNNRTIKTILRYRQKGGKFYKPEDLRKIWGLSEQFYFHVKDYILISSNNSSSKFINSVYYLILNTFIFFDCLV